MLGSVATGPYSGVAGQAITERAVRDALESGAYDKAVALGSSLVADVQAVSGPESLEVARASDLLVEALTKAGKAGDDRTLSRAEQVARLKEQILGADHVELAVSLHNLGAVRTERGEFAAAIPAHERELSLRARSLAAGDPRIADSLDYLALPLIRLQRFDDARRALDRSLGIREAPTNQSPRDLARTLELLALSIAIPASTDAGPLLSAIGIRHDLGLDEHPETISTLTYAAICSISAAIFAVRSASGALGPASLNEVWGGSSDVRPSAPRGVATTTWRHGTSAVARPRARISSASMAPCHPETTGILNDLATSARYFGSYIEARQLYGRALTVRERCLGRNHSLTATVIYNQAELATRTGDFVEAERLYRSATSAWSAALGPNHPYVALGLDALAQVLRTRGQPARARALYERALAIRRQTLGAEHPDVAWTLTNLARTIADLGNTQLALADVNQAIQIYRRAGAAVEFDQLARMLMLRGDLEMKRREYTTAQATFEEALAERERVFGQVHPWWRNARPRRLGTTLRRARIRPRSTMIERRADRPHHLRFTVRYLPERQGLLYAGSRPRGLDLALSVVAASRVTLPPCSMR